MSALKRKFSSTIVAGKDPLTSQVDRLCKFETKKNAKGTTVIEGFANRAVRDRIKDLIAGDAWELDNFKKNPIILFNHNRDIPIGRATNVSTSEDGLTAKANISRSKNGPIPFIRDMIDEGILRTFSVGFDDLEEPVETDEGLDFPKVELLEISVVTLPMNQDSTFDATGKMKGVGEPGKLMPFDDVHVKSWPERSYEDCVREVLRAKNAQGAASIYPIKQEQRTEILTHVKAPSADELDEILKGEDIIGFETIKPILDDMGIEYLDVTGKNIGEDNEDDDEEDENESKAVEPEETDEEDKKEENEEKEAPETVEDETKASKSDDEKNAFQDCVNSKIPKLIEEGMEREQAVAVAISRCQGENGKGCELSREDIAKFLIEPGEKQAEQEQVAETPTVPLDRTADPSDAGNPVMDLQKSSLAIQGKMSTDIGLMLVELQKLNNNVNSLIEVTMRNSSRPADEPGESRQEDTDGGGPSDDEKSFDMRVEKIGKMVKTFNNTLAKFGYEINQDGVAKDSV